MPRSTAAPAIHTRQVLKTYNLSSTNPPKWQDSTTAPQARGKGKPRKQNRYSVLQDQRLDYDESLSGLPDGVEDEQDPLGIYGGVFSILRKKGIPIDTSPTLASAYLLSSRTFDPLSFLSVVHANSTPNTLSTGLENLQESLQQESGALKQLVTGDFDRFVRCKNGIDEVYERMVEGGFTESQGFGTAGIKKTLDESTAKAEELYNPVLDSRAKAERLRATLIILQRHKEYFNLPSLIASDIKKADTESLLISYSRAQSLHSEYTGTTPLTSGPPSASTALANRRVFDKVWEECQRLVAGYRNGPMRKLKDLKGFGSGSTRGSGNVDTLLEGVDLLISLNEPTHPLPTLIQHHTTSLLTTASSLTEKHTAQIELLRRKLVSATPLTASTRRLTFLQAIAKATDKPPSSEKARQASGGVIGAWTSGGAGNAGKEFGGRDVGWDTAGVEDMWRAVGGYCAEIGGLIGDLVGLKEVVDRICDKSSITSSTQKLTLTPTQQSQITASLTTTLQSLLSTLQAFFTSPPPRDLGSYFSPNPALNSIPSTPISDMPSQDLADKSALDDTMSTDGISFLPPGSSALGCCKWSYLILEGLSRRVGECVSWGEESADVVRIAVGGIRERIVKAALVCWREDAENFYVLEDWVIDKGRGNGVTGWVAGIHSYQRQVIQALEQLVNFGANFDPGRRVVGKIRGGVVAECKKEFESTIFASLETSIKLAKGSVVSPVSEDIEQDIRVLLCISNLAELKGSTIPKIVNLFENAFELSFTDNLKGIMEIANTIDEKLFMDYTRRRARQIKDIVKKGILEGIDWSDLKQPFDVQSYVHQALLSLVSTHAQITSTSSSILPRVMTSLIESFASDLLVNFRRIPSFNMGGMLQATLEVEFLHQTLGSNVSKAAGDTLQAVYGTIEKQYTGAGGVDLELGKVKGLLQRSRAGTKYVYGCFRGEKRGKVGGREGNGGGSVRTKTGNGSF